jgi:hypothetical protein
MGAGRYMVRHFCCQKQALTNGTSRIWVDNQGETREGRAIPGLDEPLVGEIWQPNSIN